MSRGNRMTALLKPKFEVEYVTWLNMLYRCHNPEHYDYPGYGAQGITVCDRWRDAENGFLNFLLDMGPRPGAGLSIERKNGKAGYSPQNCVWADRVTQQNNRGGQGEKFDAGLGITARGSALVEFRGTRLSIHNWARFLNVRPGLIRGRLRRGQTVEAALSIAPTKRKPRQGVLKSILIGGDTHG